MTRILRCFLCLVLCAACSKPRAPLPAPLAAQAGEPAAPAPMPLPLPFPTEAPDPAALDTALGRILGDAGIPEQLSWNILRAASQGPSFILDVLAVLDGDPYLRVLVDKAHALPARYEPADLTALGGGSYRVSRAGLFLRHDAAQALEVMAAAAKAGGVTLTASSAYRTYAYQQALYQRNVAQDGQYAADRESARAGHSQHQLGLVVDFGSIDDSFADTQEGRWLLANAGSFGWSLSFPEGYEEVTGYRWESWHYRYVGRELVYFIDTYFEGIQQYALQFIYAWEKAGGL